MSILDEYSDLRKIRTGIEWARYDFAVRSEMHKSSVELLDVVWEEPLVTRAYSQALYGLLRPYGLRDGVNWRPMRGD